MKNLQQATERICELKGSLMALDALLTAVLRSMPDDAQRRALMRFAEHAEAARAALLHGDISEHTLAAFERDVRALQVLGAER